MHSAGIASKRVYDEMGYDDGKAGGTKKLEGGVGAIMMI
jgi:hypothetical protein